MSSILLTARGRALFARRGEAFLRVEHADDDNVIASLIAAARIHVEAQAWRA